MGAIERIIAKGEKGQFGGDWKSEVEIIHLILDGKENDAEALFAKCPEVNYNRITEFIDGMKYGVDYAANRGYCV